MIEHARGLTDTALEAVAALERRVLATDGGRLKLEWTTLRSRSDGAVRDLLWWQGEELLGFLGIYGFRAGWFELAGMVDPGARRRGIGRALLDAALPLVRAAGDEHVLLIVPRTSSAGRELAASYGMAYEHSEHALRLVERPLATTPGDPALSLRAATIEDLPALSGLYRDAFGSDDVDERRLAGERSRTLMIARGGETVGTLALTRDGERGAIYGFVVDRSQRGRGIGRQALRRACQDLFAAGAEYVDLEVAVDNDGALGLYTSVGFTQLATDDYYEYLP